MPQYWNISGSTGDSSLNGMANSGRESDSATELEISRPLRGFTPIGRPHGENRKNHHPSVCMARSPTRTQATFSGLRNVQPAQTKKATVPNSADAP